MYRQEKAGGGEEGVKAGWVKTGERRFYSSVCCRPIPLRQGEGGQPHLGQQQDSERLRRLANGGKLGIGSMGV